MAGQGWEVSLNSPGSGTSDLLGEDTCLALADLSL